MREVLTKMAEYNLKAMDALLAVVDKAPAGLSSKEVGVYYKTIDGTVEHMAWAMVLWLQRFASFGSYPCLESSPLVKRPIAETKASVTGDRAKSAALFREAGALLGRFAAELPEAEFSRSITYKTTDGKEFTKTMWHALFHVLNHGTHHRGEISAVLDQHGVANDCSGFTLYIG